MREWLGLVLTVMLSAQACRATLDVERPGQGQIATAPPGSTVIEEPNGSTIIEPPAKPLCHVRARHFVGSVDEPCEEVARETSPGGLRP